MDILLETTLMVSYSAMPRLGHLENVLQIFGYSNLIISLRFVFIVVSQFPPNKFKEYDWEDFYKQVKEDIPLDPPTPRKRSASTTMFVDASHVNDRKNIDSMKEYNIALYFEYACTRALVKKIYH